MQKCKVLAKLCANFSQMCSTIEFQNDRRQTEEEDQDEGQSFDILKTMIFHGGRIAIHLTCEICCSKMHSSPFFYSFWRCLHFPFRALLCGFLSWPILIIIKITKRIISGFSFIFFHIITSSIYRFSQKKRIGLIIENSIEMRVG